MAYISQIKLSDTTYDISAYKLKNARTIFGQSFDGTANVAGKPLVYGSYISDAAYRYGNSGIEVRENGLVGSAQSDIGYAPSIGFHWNGKVAASLLLHSDGNFYLRKQDGTSRASLDANLIGNAATATKLATARTISLTGSITGSGTFDGSGNLSIATTTNHSHSYLPLAGGTMNDQAWISWPDTGNWANSNAGVTFPVQHGGLQWTGQSDWIKIFSEESASDMLDMIMQFGDDGSSALKIRHSNGTDTIKLSAAGRIDASTVYGAVWNDYAEFRICNEDFKPGQVVLENGDDTLSIASQRLQRGCSIVSDTFGFAIGETDEAKCPIAVSGRVLAYGYESREEFKKHIGWPVCSGPNGTVSIMTEEEEEKYSSRIIGTISAVPNYETWGTGNVEVNNRIWIKIK